MATSVRVRHGALNIPDDLRAVRFYTMKRGDTVPHRIARPCRAFMCPNTTTNANGYCDEHQVLARERRGSARQRGYTYDWEKASKAFLREHPLCVECLKENRLTPAEVVDHIIPHRGNKKLFWDKSNWQSLCKHHHDQKTARGL